MLIAATWCGDGVASALACGHALLGSGGGSESATASARTSVEEAAPRARRAWRARRLGPASCGGGRVVDVALGRLSEAERAQSSKRCFALVLWHDSLRTGLSELVLPWHATKSSVARREFANFTWYLLRYEKKMPFYLVPYLWYLKSTLWRCRSYDFQAPGLPTTETYGQLDLSRSTHIDPER